MTVRGRNFAEESSVLFDGAAVRSRYSSSETMVFSVPPVAGGLHNVQVKNQDETVSGTIALLIDARPEIVSVTTGTEAVNYYELHLRGKNFQQGSTVIVDGKRVGTGLANRLLFMDRVRHAIVDAGVVVVTTSNRPPDDLYKDGLNRELFLPFIALIKQRLDVLVLDAARDYRRERILGLPTWHRWQSLFELAHLAVAHRPGFTLGPDTPNMPQALREAWQQRHRPTLPNAAAGSILLREMTALDISASRIRETLRQGRSARYLLPDAVRDYVHTHHLYLKEPHAT